MSDLGAIAAVVSVASMAASGMCFAMAYHVPERLRGVTEYCVSLWEVEEEPPPRAWDAPDRPDDPETHQ